MHGGRPGANDPKAALERADPALTKRIAWGEGFTAAPARTGDGHTADDYVNEQALLTRRLGVWGEGLCT